MEGTLTLVPAVTSRGRGPALWPASTDYACGGGGQGLARQMGPPVAATRLWRASPWCTVPSTSAAERLVGGGQGAARQFGPVGPLAMMGSASLTWTQLFRSAARRFGGGGQGAARHIGLPATLADAMMTLPRASASATNAPAAVYWNCAILDAAFLRVFFSMVGLARAASRSWCAQSHRSGMASTSRYEQWVGLFEGAASPSSSSSSVNKASRSSTGAQIFSSI